MRIISEEYNWVTETNGKLTFAGALDACWNTLTEKYWKESSTQIQYLRDFDRYVIPFCRDKALIDCSRDDFDFVLDELQKKKEEEGRAFNENVLRHFKWIIHLVLRTAAEAGIAQDVLWGTDYCISEGVNEDRLCKKELEVGRKSFRISEEISLRDKVLLDPLQRGEYFGLALMYCLGTRNSEATGADFGDIHFMECDSSIATLWVYKTTERGNNSQSMEGKTRNFARIVPIPRLLLSLLMNRRRIIEESISSKYQAEHGGEVLSESSLNAIVDGMPIVCVGTDFEIRCSGSKLTQLGTLLMREIKVEQEVLSLIDFSIRKPGSTEEGFAEKDATAYLCRRNFCTHLYILGLEESEIQYIMGHEISDDSDDRNTFRNEDSLYPIAKKMALRPIVNDVPDEEACEMSDGWVIQKDIYKSRVTIPLSRDSQSFHVEVRQREPNAELKISFECDGCHIEGEYTQIPIHNEYPNPLRITDDYLRIFKKTEAKKGKLGRH